jgi:NADH-quinone oxidoreductase subunit M
MVLALFIFVPLFLGILMAGMPDNKGKAAAFVFGLVAALGLALLGQSDIASHTLDLSWMPSLGVRFHLRLDGLSFLFLLLSYIVAAAISLAHFNELATRPPFYTACLLWILGSLSGVLLAKDAFVFFFFWEASLLPLFLLALRYAKNAGSRVATKVFIFSQLSGLSLLAGICVLHAAHLGSRGVATFDIVQLLSTFDSGSFAPVAGMALIILAFLVKLPILPFQGWFTAFYQELPLSAVMMGLLVKTGVYGFLRFVAPISSQATPAEMSWLIAIGIFTLYYGCVLAYGRSTLRDVLAYATISHMGLALVVMCLPGDEAKVGVLIAAFSQALATAALLVVSSYLEGRFPALTFSSSHGLFKSAPIYGVFSLISMLALLGLPGLGTFVGEFFMLYGIFKSSPVLAVVCALSVVLNAAYMLRAYHALFLGSQSKDLMLEQAPAKASLKHVVVLASLSGLLLFIGLTPKPLIQLLSYPLTAPENARESIPPIELTGCAEGNRACSHAEKLP